MHRRSFLVLAATLPAMGFAPPGTAATARVVVAGGALTEIAFALGAGDRLIGTDTTSTFPAEADRLPKIGYFRSLSTEGILSLNPTLLIATDQAGPPTVISQLMATRLDVRLIPETFDPSGVPDKVRQVADALQLSKRGELLAAEISRDLHLLRESGAPRARSPAVLFLMSVADGKLLAAGAGTAADAMIRLAGGRNSLSGMTGYKPLSAEAALAAAPDVLLLPQHTLQALGGVAGIQQVPQLQYLHAVRKGRVVAMDLMYLLGLGPRVAKAGRDLAAAIAVGA